MRIIVPMLKSVAAIVSNVIAERISARLWIEDLFS